MIEYKIESQLVDDFLILVTNETSPWGILKAAKEFNYQRGRTDVVAVDKNDNVIAFEMKLLKWKEALSQAFKNTCYANFSYVVLPKKTALVALKHKSEFDKRAVGLCFLSEGKLYTLINSDSQNPIQPWLTKKAKSLITG